MKEPASLIWTLAAWNCCSGMGEKFPSIAPGSRIYYQRVSLDDVLPGEEQLRRIEAIAVPYAMQPQSIMEEQESRPVA